MCVLLIALKTPMHLVPYRSVAVPGGCGRRAEPRHHVPQLNDSAARTCMYVYIVCYKNMAITK